MRKRIIKVISVISILLSCLLGYYFLNKYYSFSIPCLFYKVTNWYCPGCGITRCLFSLLEGNIKQAFYYNQLVTVLLGPFVIYEIIRIIGYVKEKELIKVPNIVWNLLLVIVIIFGIVRNLV